MKNLFFKNSILVTIAISTFLFTSCEPDDVCLPTDAPFVTTNLRYPNSTTALEDTIFYKVYYDSILISEGDIKNKSTLNLPIQITNTNQIKYILQQGSNYTVKQNNETYVQHIAPVDTIYINYNLADKYYSKACGFGTYFTDATYTTTNNWIKSIENVNPTIENATTTNLIIFAEPRSK